MTTSPILLVTSSFTIFVERTWSQSFLSREGFGFRPGCPQFAGNANGGPLGVRKTAEEIAVADDFDDAGNVLDRGFVNVLELAPRALTVGSRCHTACRRLGNRAHRCIFRALFRDIAARRRSADDFVIRRIFWRRRGSSFSIKFLPPISSPYVTVFPPVLTPTTPR